MRIALIILIGLAFTSCASLKRKICIKETVIKTVVDTIYSDTTIYITKEGTTVTLDNPCAELCDSFGNLIPFEIVETVGGIKQTITAINNKLVLKCDTDSMQFIIDSLLTTKTVVTITERVEVERKKNWFDRIQELVFWVVVVVGFIFIVRLFR